MGEEKDLTESDYEAAVMKYLEHPDAGSIRRPNFSQEGRSTCSYQWVSHPALFLGVRKRLGDMGQHLGIESAVERLASLRKIKVSLKCTADSPHTWRGPKLIHYAIAADPNK